MTTPIEPTPNLETKIEIEAKLIASKFVSEYDAFTQTLIRHPKTFFFTGILAGYIAGFLVH